MQAGPGASEETKHQGKKGSGKRAKDGLLEGLKHRDGASEQASNATKVTTLGEFVPHTDEFHWTF